MPETSGENTLLVQSFSVAMDRLERKAKEGGGRAKGEVRTGKNPAQYSSALSANRPHSVSGKITSSLFQSSAAVALSGGFLVARSLLFDSRDEGGQCRRRRRACSNRVVPHSNSTAE